MTSPWPNPPGQPSPTGPPGGPREKCPPTIPPIVWSLES